MQTPTIRPPKLSKDSSGPLSTKNGSIAAALVAAAIAGLLIVFFLQQYRSNVNKDGVPTAVLVATQVIEQGASGDTAGAQSLFKTTNVPRDQLKAGAVSDPAKLRGEVAVEQLVPGQQITDADFKPAGQGLVTKLAADQRAIAVAVDTAHGLIGKIKAGDHVDVLTGFEADNSAGGNQSVLRMLLQDVLVMGVPKKAAGGVSSGANETSEVTLRVATNAAPKLAFAADNGKVWLVLRPLNGAKLDRPSLVTLQSLLVGTKPVRASGGSR
jgi:Flp pilus assembly protein CpaB